MGLFKRKYELKGWNGNKHFLTAKALYKRIMRDSRSDYNWIASATSIVKVISQETFPDKYKYPIEIAIVRCFTNLENRRAVNSREEATDIDAVSYCYNDLGHCIGEASEVRFRYLKAVIEKVARTHFSYQVFPYYGKTFHTIKEEWTRTMFTEYASIPDLDFSVLRQSLHDDFEMIMRQAEQEGKLEQDHQDRVDKLRPFWVICKP